MADIIILIIISAAALLGYKKGFAKAVFNLGYHIVALIVATVSYPMVTSALKGTKLYTIIFDAIFKKASEGNFINVEALPEFLRETAQSGVNAVAQNTATTITDLIVTILSIVIIFIAVKLLLGIIAKVLDLFAKLPVIKSFNKLGGFLFGALSGAIIVYIILAVLTMIPDSAVTKFVTESTVASAMYNNNIILQFVLREKL